MTTDTDIYQHERVPGLHFKGMEETEVYALIEKKVKLPCGEIHLYLLRRLDKVEREINPFVVGMKGRESLVLLDFNLSSARLRFGIRFRHQDFDWWTASKLMRTLKKQLGQNGKKKNGK